MSREHRSRWQKPWLAVQFTDDSDHVVTFLRWFAEVENHLELMVAADDPLLAHVRQQEAVAVAPVARRGASDTSRNYEPATIRIGDDAMADRLGAALDVKYGWRRRIFRQGFWIVRRLAGGRRARVDVALSIVVHGEEV